MNIFSFALLVCVFWVSINVASVRGQTEDQAALLPSVLTGVYSEEQATLGQGLYYQHCLACHGEMMNGLDQAPPLAGPQFSGVWHGESLWALVERIATMPPDKPGKLSTPDNVAILAYILWYNNLPLSNVSLGTDKDVLSTITFQTPLGQ